MSLFNPHHPERLAALAAGTLSLRKRGRALAHLRGCTDCAQRYERLVLAERMLAGGRAHEPSPTELSSLRSANRAAVLAAARGEPAQRSLPLWRWAPVLALGASAVVAVTVLRPSAPSSEFAARGEPARVPAATLRVFCARPEGALAELGAGGRCPAGATLAFSARFEAPPSAVVLEVLGGPTPQRVELPVTARPGEEGPLAHTVLLEGSGPREVVLTVGKGALRHTVYVEPAR